MKFWDPVEVRHGRESYFIVIHFISKQKKYSAKSKNRKYRLDWFRALQDLCIHNAIKWKFHKKAFSIEMFFCLFCNVRGSKPTCTRTQNRDKERNSLIKLKALRFTYILGPDTGFTCWYDHLPESTVCLALYLPIKKSTRDSVYCWKLLQINDWLLTLWFEKSRLREWFKRHKLDTYIHVLSCLEMIAKYISRKF
jgi:hypothetical protein